MLFSKTRLNIIEADNFKQTVDTIFNSRHIIEVNSLRGPTPFDDMIFYLWTDSNEICTAYVKLNSKHILFMRIF